MIDPRNNVILTAGIVSEPELIANGNIAKFRIAVDYAGSEKGAGVTSGYFDVTYYLKDGSDFASKNASFVAKQISEGKMKKGSQVQLVGRLVQERWQQEGQGRSKVVVVAEAVTYVGSSFQKSDSSSGSSTETKQSNSSYSVPDEF
jgi:single-stranded DNA-binding protein